MSGQEQDRPADSGPGHNANCSPWCKGDHPPIDPQQPPAAAAEGDRGVCGLCVQPMHFTEGRWVHGYFGEELCAS